MESKNKYANNKGITLIALVITILVLLILAGIAISMVVGNNGIMNKTTTAVETHRNASAEEEIALAWASCEVDYNVALSGDYTAKDRKADYFTADNLNKYLVGKGTVDSVTYVEDGESTVTYSSISDANIIDKTFKVDKNGKVKIATSTAGGTGENGGNASNLTAEETALLAENNMTELKEDSYPENMQGNENIKAVITGEGGIVPIPVNCTYVTGSNNEDSESYGVVIKDSIENEWVWIPVPDATVMYNENSNGVALSGTTGVTTKKYSKSEILSGKTRGTPGTTSYREPDIVTGYDKDANAGYLTQAGFETKTAAYMAQTIVDEYENMIKSVTQYGGFYVGRYELSGTVASPTVQKEKDSLTEVNWYQLYNANKTLGNGIEGVTTGMIWGCEWDIMCNWIASSGDKKDINNSTSWGNYYDATVTDNNNATLKASETGQKLKTGITDYTKANNIYDVAGNFFEWTMEASSTYNRANRGGDYDGYGSFGPASYRYSISPDYTITDDSSRSTLIINPVP